MAKNARVNWEWTHTLASLKVGEFPDLGYLRGALIGEEDIPREVRLFFVDLIESGQIVRKGRGRPNVQDAFSQHHEDEFFRDQYRAELERIRLIPKRDRKEPGTPSEIALERVAEVYFRHFEIRLTPEAIKKRLTPSRKRKKSMKKKKARKAKPFKGPNSQTSVS